MAVKCLDAGEELAVVADGDEHLHVRAHGGLKDRERAGREFVLLELGNLVLAVKFPMWLAERVLATWGMG